MPGIYIHIPFCKQACTYCNFHFSTSLAAKKEMVQAIRREIEQVKFFRINEKIETIYFGGGTPGILEAAEIQNILDSIYRKFSVSENCEITIEVNPDDVCPHKAKAWLNMGINRLSIGIQSFDEAELKWMNRAHTAKQSLTCLEVIKVAGFTNFSTDLIYGSPLQNEKILRENIDILLSFHVPHISAYALTVEEKTVLNKKILTGKALAPSPEIQAAMYEQLVDTLERNNFQQYEISNFSLPGMESRHNSSYWKGEAYYGFGPSAHAYDGANTRSWNISNNALYISQINAGIDVAEKEILTTNEKRNEMIMIGLRTAEGLNLQQFKNLTGENQTKNFLGKGSRFIEEGFAEINGDYFRLTKKGKFLADGIASDLFEI